MPITMTDIARKCGVSQPAVSAVLNNNFTNCRVSETKRKKILKVAEELHFSPNALAQSLATKKTRIFNLVIPSATFFLSYNYTTIIMGLQGFADGIGYRLTFTSLSFGYKDYRPLSGIIADGIILFYWGAAHAPVVRRVQKLGLPLLTAYGRCTLPDTHNLYFENRPAMRALTAGLIKKGYRRLMYAPSYTGDIFHQDGRAGIREAVAGTDGVVLTEEPLADRIPLETADQFLFRSGYAHFRRTLEKPGRPEVIMYNHDWTAQGALQAARDTGTRVPEDMALTSSGSDLSSELIEPTLTTVDLRPLEYGRSLGAAMQDIIEGKPLRTRQEAFRPEPVFRHSTRL